MNVVVSRFTFLQGMINVCFTSCYLFVISILSVCLSLSLSISCLSVYLSLSPVCLSISSLFYQHYCHYVFISHPSTPIIPPSLSLPLSDSESDEVHIHGPKEDVMKAKVMLLEIATKYTQEHYTEEIKCKPEYHR